MKSPPVQRLRRELQKAHNQEQKKEIHYVGTGPQYWSPAFTRWIARGVTMGAYLRSHPFYWDSKSKQIKRRKDFGNLFLWHVNIVVFFAFFGFVAFRAVTGFRDPTFSDMEKLLLIFASIGFLLPIIFQLWIKQSSNDLEDGFNQGVKLMTGFCKHTPAKSMGHQKLMEIRQCEFVLMFIFIGMQFVAIVFVLLNVLMLDNKTFLTSLKFCRQNKLCQLISVLAVAYYMEILATAIYMQCFPGLPLLFSALAAITGLHENPGMRHPRTAMSRLQYYWQLRILSEWFFGLYGSFIMFPVYEILFIMQTTLGIVGLLRFQGILGTALGAFGFQSYLCLFVVGHGLGELYVRSRKMLRHWNKLLTIDKRTERNLRFMKCNLGSFGFVEPAILLTVTHIIISSSINLLLVW